MLEIDDEVNEEWKTPPEGFNDDYEDDQVILSKSIENLN